MPLSEPRPENSQPTADTSELCVWRCPNCGQSYFGKNPPDLCDYCQDFTTWQRVEAGSQ